VRVQTYGNGNIDREILISMVVDARVLGAIAAKWPEDGRLFASDWANTVARWCVKHHRDYGKPPRKSIRGYFDRWAERGRDKEEVTAMENFLAALSGQYDQYDRNGDGPDPQYVIDLARDRFTAVRMQDSIEKLKAQLDRGDVAKAEEIWNSFRRVDVGTGAGVDLLTEKQAVRTAFETKSEVLIKFGDPYADAFFGDALSRDEFIVVTAKEKGGKSFTLQEIALRGVENKRNVAFFELGDQSQNQIIRRIAARIARHPHKLTQSPQTVSWPTSITRNGNGPPEVQFEDLTFTEPLSADAAVKAVRRFGKKWMGFGESRLRLSCHPASSVNAPQIEAVLEDWARDGWRSDIVIIDYLDLMSPINGTADTRDQINANWKALRGINLKWHVLLVGGTQANRASYEAEYLTRDNFSEDKRKNAHVTGMLGINQTDDEAVAQIVRYNWMLLRDLPFTNETYLYAATCLAVANPMVCFTM